VRHSSQPVSLELPSKECRLGQLAREYPRIIVTERALVPQALNTLGIPHESIVYEKLVADPRGSMERCLKRMGLAMKPTVLAPESNASIVLTLSLGQVRKPINRSSIGRWKNYGLAFGAEWD
jgi:hypothetical protein